MKKIITRIIMPFVMLSCLTSCGEKPTQGVSRHIPSPADAPVKLEDAANAQAGDAYLAIADSDWSAQFLGADKDMAVLSSLSFNAGLAPITGNGDYKVSVTANTKGYRWVVSGDADNINVRPHGLSFMAVMIKDGENQFPNAVITVNSIKVDGNEIEMTAKPYTSSDDDIDTRANIYNTYVGSRPTKDARTADGMLYDEARKPLPICDEYSPIAVSPDDFSAWTTVEVEFTVTGIDR